MADNTRFYTDDPERLAREGFPVADDPAQAEAFIFFSDPRSPADTTGKPCFIVSEYIGLSEAICLAFAGVLVVKDAAQARAVLELLKAGHHSPTLNEEPPVQGREPSAPEDEMPSSRELENELPCSPGDDNGLTWGAGWTGLQEESGLVWGGDDPRCWNREEYGPARQNLDPLDPNVEDLGARQDDCRFSHGEDGWEHDTWHAGGPDHPPDDGAPLPNLIASYSPSTSVGKTFVAVNAAAWLAANGLSVALVDLDPDKTDLWRTAHMEAVGPPRVTVSNWHDIEGDPLPHIARHPRLPGLAVVPGTTVVGGRLPDAGEVSEVLLALAGSFDVVVADLNAMLRLSHVAAALRLAGKVFLLSDLSDKCVAQTGMVFSQASSIVGREKMSLVVNRVGRGHPYRPRDVAKMFGFSEFSEIPEDTAVVYRCLRERRFPVEDRSAVGRALAACFERELAGFVPALQARAAAGAATAGKMKQIASRLFPKAAVCEKVLSKLK